MSLVNSDEPANRKMKHSRTKELFITFLGICASAAVLAGFGIIFYFFYYAKALDLTTPEGTESLSTIGEFFGGTVGSIWALAGVILFYLALIYQRRELELQRDT